MKTFKLYTLGCKVNQYDSSYLNSKLIAVGLKSAEKDADLAIINTCAVTKTAIKKDKIIIAKAKKENPRAKIIVIGCWPKIYGNKIDARADLVLNNKNLDDLADDILGSKSPLGLLEPSRFSSDTSDSKSPLGLLESSRSRYTVKIQDGCEQFCSYCVIPYARGKLQSRPADEVLCEIKAAVGAGYGETVLCGIHLGLYGRGVLPRFSSGREALASNQQLNETRYNLAGLLKKIIKIKNLGRIRLSSIEVVDIDEDLIELMANSKGKICRHLHLPLQSGCDKILKLMNRPYDTAYFRNKIQALRKAMPDIAITTDVIVGFPGENEADFKKTYEFIKEIKFSRLHVFPFSAHEKTPAYFMKDKVSREVKEARAKKLRELGKKLENKYRKKFIGRELEVVIENEKGDKYIGKSEFYFDVPINKSQQKSFDINIIGQIVKIKYKQT